MPRSKRAMLVGLLLSAVCRIALADPILGYGSFLGASGDDKAYAIGLDAGGNIVVAGTTTSPDFPLASPLQSSCASCASGGPDLFVAKLDPTGKKLLYATYVGGSDADALGGMAVSPGGDAILAGTTFSADFPTANPLQPLKGKGADAFLLRIAGDGSALLYATFLGGGEDDEASDVAIGPTGAAYVAGTTASWDFPVHQALQPSLNGPSDAFLAVVDAGGGSFVYSTFLGGEDEDAAQAVAVDLLSAPFVLVNGSAVKKLDPGGTKVMYSAKLPAGVTGLRVAVDAARYASVVGYADDCGGGCPGRPYPFIAGITPQGAVSYITNLGPDAFSSLPCAGYARSVAVDAMGNAYVGGSAIAVPWRCTLVPFGGGQGSDVSTFIAKVTPQGVVSHEVPLGGGGEDVGLAIACDSAGSTWVAGMTMSSDFPQKGSLQGTYDAGYDGFLARVDDAGAGAPPEAAFTAATGDAKSPSRTGCVGRPFLFLDQSECDVTSVRWDFGDGATSSFGNPSHVYSAPGRYTVSLTAQNGVGSATETRVDDVEVLPPLHVDFSASPARGMAPLDVLFTPLVSGGAASYRWWFGDGATSTDPTPTHTYGSAGHYSVTLSASNGYSACTFDATKPDAVEVTEVASDFSASPRIGRPPLTVAFTDRSEGDVRAHLWDFGDGATSTLASPTHTYASVGRYPVSLTVYGPTTQDSLRRADYVLVSAYPPVNLVTGPGPDPAAPPLVLGFDVLGVQSGATRIFAYGSVGYGCNVGTGDINASGTGEILTGPGPSAVFGPQVRAFEPDSTPLARVSFYAYGTLRYGVAAAGASVDADPYGEIMAFAGPGAVFGPHVRGFNVDGSRPSALADLSFFAYGTLRYGVTGSGGDVSGNGAREVLTAPGPGPAFGPLVRAFRYVPPARPVGKVNFYAFAALSYGGRVAGSDVDADGWDELITAQGPGPALPATLRGYNFDGEVVTSMPGVEVTAFGGAFGAEPRGGDLDGDGAGEILAGRGPDPAAMAEAKGFDLAGTVVPIPSLDITPYATACGLHLETGPLGF